MQWIIPPIPGLAEPAVAPEFYIDDVGAIERVGSMIRVYYCAAQLPLEAGPDAVHHIVAAKIVRPIATIPRAIWRLAHCLDHGVGQEVARGQHPHIVR